MNFWFYTYDLTFQMNSGHVSVGIVSGKKSFLCPEKETKKGKCQNKKYICQKKCKNRRKYRVQSAVFQKQIILNICILFNKKNNFHISFWLFFSFENINKKNIICLHILLSKAAI